MVHGTRDSDEFAGGTQGMGVPGGAGCEGARVAFACGLAAVCVRAFLSSTITLPDTARAGKTSSDYHLCYFLHPYIAVLYEFGD